MRSPAFNGGRSQGSFFERLDADLPVIRSIDDRNHLVSVVGAIKRHLEWLLNSRRGNSESAPDLGLDDFNDATGGSTDFTLKIANNIKTTILQYEPRVVVHDVEYSPNPDNPLELKFKVIGHIPMRQNNKDVLIELILNGHTKHYDVY